MSKAFSEAFEPDWIGFTSARTSSIRTHKQYTTGEHLGRFTIG